MPPLTQRLARATAMLAATALVPVAGLVATSAPVLSAPVLDDAQSRLATPVSLARPDDGWVFKGRNLKWSTAEAGNSPRCHATYPICVHWTNGGGDAPAPGDGNGDGIPNQVEETLAAAATSWDVIVNDLGFRAPLPDGRSRFDGGDADFDIYLADTGDKKLAGYTSSDDPRLSDASNYKFRDVSAFMVVDNDFRAEQFKFGSADDNMKVTVAHELFHASQFAYDHNEDRWLTEGTATWVEDEVFDGIDLNRRALSKSPIGIPTTALDFARNGHEYGSWLFFRYLSENFGKDFIRRVWRFADDSTAQTSTDRMRTFSMRAVSRALATRQRDIHQVFASFVHDNLRPADTYEEGGSYPKPYSFRYELDRQAGDSGWLGLPLDHLSSAYVTIVPGDDVRRTGKVLLRFDGPPRKFDPRFRVTVRFLGGASKDFTVGLDRHGNGQLRVAFGRDGVAGVDVAMINTSTRMRDCFKHATPYSCSGSPKDDDRTYAIRARLP